MGDPLRLELADDVLVDLRELEAGRLELVEQWGALGSDLLEPLDFSGSATFAVWLENRRRQVRGLTEGLVHERVQIELARGAARRAAELSAVLVRMEPLDEGHQALLVRSLAAAGDGVGAARQVAACRELFRRELGTEPGVWLDAAARVVTRHPVAAARTGRPSVVASIDAGVAAVEAGSVDAGVECLRRAVDEGAALGDPELEVRALTELGTALVHSVRGRDDEGAVALHRAVARAGDRFPAWVAVATRELGYVEFLRGRYDRVEPWLSRATAAAAGDVAQLARIATVRGCALTDLARYAEAEVALRYAVEHTRDDRFRSYPWSMLGRVHLLRGELALAADALDTSLDLALHTGWTALVPWPDALRAEVDLLRGDPDAAANRSRRAFLASCRLGDPCWEGISGRVRGLLHAAQGQPEQALAALADARVRCTRLPRRLRVGRRADPRDHLHGRAGRRSRPGQCGRGSSWWPWPPGAAWPSCSGAACAIRPTSAGKGPARSPRPWGPSSSGLLGSAGGRPDADRAGPARDAAALAPGSSTRWSAAAG